MQNPIKIAIIGFGNVGRGVIKAIERNADTKLVCILSRSTERVKKELADTVPVFDADNLDELKKADVAILCSGSKDDL
ncbi:MAG: NAD(P)-binding domain-containing protein, partial [Crenarchaeota archaeon]|nr:NAD(P)-binding domain-containing protein [Thermoproteota archaeon]